MIKLKLDASALKESSCETCFANNVIHGYRDPAQYNDTQFGTAGHKFIAVMQETKGDFSLAIPAAEATFDKHTKVRKKKEHITKNYLIKTCIDLWQNHIAKDGSFKSYIDPTTGLPLVERTFCFPLLTRDGVQVELAGTMDDIGKITNGVPAIRDYKFTSSYNPITFLGGFRSSPQLKTYNYALKRLARDNPDSIFTEITKYPLGTFIDGIFLSSSPTAKLKVIRSDVFVFKDAEMDEFEQLLLYKANQLIDLVTRPALHNGKIEGTCFRLFGCKYHDICNAVDDVAAAHVLKNTFVTKPYDPLHFNDE